MAIFSPIMYIKIDASDCYEELAKTQRAIHYRIAIGREGNVDNIVKIQLLIDGKIQPRGVPNYSLTNFTEISNATKWLITQYDNVNEVIRNKMQKVDLTEEYEKTKGELK